MATHNGTIESELTGGWVAVCDCGFSGSERDGYTEAISDLADHYAEFETPSQMTQQEQDRIDCERVAAWWLMLCNRRGEFRYFKAEAPCWKGEVEIPLPWHALVIGWQR